MKLRSVVLLACLGFATAGLAACQPPPPLPVLVVNAHGSHHDADPGDGVCETEAGNGVCSLAAAVDEGNAVGRAEIRVPWAIQGQVISDDRVDGQITGRLLIKGTDMPAGADPRTFPIAVTVVAGAELVLDSVGVRFGPLVVEGALVTNRVLISEGGVVVTESGSAMLSSTLFWGSPADQSPLITNRGRVVARFVSLQDRLGPGPTVSAAPGSTTDFGASWITGDSISPTCTGPVTSSGYSASSDTTCGFDAATDQPNTWYAFSQFQSYQPPLVPGIDAVPVGVLGCGAGNGAVDFYGFPRAADADGDGVAQCDLGAMEVRRPPWATG